MDEDTLMLFGIAAVCFVLGLILGLSFAAPFTQADEFATICTHEGGEVKEDICIVDGKVLEIKTDE